MLSLVHAAPVADPEPFIPIALPAVTGAITLTVPALTIPGIGVILNYLIILILIFLVLAHSHKPDTCHSPGRQRLVFIFKKQSEQGK